MGKFFFGILVGSLLLASIFLMGRTSESKLRFSESITPQFLVDLEAAEKKLFDPDSLAKHGVILYSDRGSSTGTSQGLIDHIRSEGLIRGRLTVVASDEDPRKTVIRRVQDLVRLADAAGFIYEHAGYRSFSFGKGTRTLGPTPPGESWDPKDRFIAVDVQLRHRNNPTLFMTWNLILDTETLELSSERWVNGLHPVRY